MRTISWKHSVIALFAVAAFAACSDDTTSNPPADSGVEAGKKCGNGKLDTDEQCDGTKLNSKTCSTQTMGMKPSGTLKCKSDCSGFDITGCTSSGGGAGGGAGMGTGGSGNAGT